MSFLLLFLSLGLCNSQYISIITCSDLDCKSNCNSNIVTDNKCSNTNPYSITTLTSYSIYSDSNCKTMIPNTYKTPIITTGDCNKLYLYGNVTPSGSYRAYNLSLLIGVGFLSLFLLTTIIITIIKCSGYKICYCKKIQPPPQNNAIIIETQNYPIMNYGYPDIVDYSIKPNHQYYHPPLPSAPPAPSYEYKFI